MPAQLDGLEVADNQRKKQSRFDITNTPLAQAGQRKPLPSIADVSQPVQQVPGNADRARRMQAQFDQPVTRGTPPSIVAGAGGRGVKGGVLAATGASPAPQAQALPSIATPSIASNTPGQGDTPAGNGYTQAGNGIAMRVGAGGVPEFTNDASVVAGAGAMPQGGMARIGDGIGGGLSVGAPGDSQLAIDRFERANQERQKMIDISRRGQIGEGGGRVTIVRDSSRAPSLADVLNTRLDASQAQASLQNQQAQQGILAGLDDRLTNQLNRQKTQQELAAGQVGLENQQRLAKLGAMLANPELGQRADVEREYLLRADPKAYVDQQAKAGIGQVELETKQIKRDLLRSELEQGGAGGNLKLTEQQSKDLGYYTRGNEANAQLARQGDALTSRATGERGQIRGISDTVIRGAPLIGDSALANSLVSTERQQAEQAGREVLAAILRKDTGAAITNQEMEIYGKMYLPQAGDSEEVLNQKAEARTRALASIRGGLGTAERKAAPLLNGQRTSDEAPTRISGDAEYDALPSGALFIAPDGTTRRKP